MQTAAAFLTILLAAATALPFLPFAHGIVRIGDFPRQQILAIAVLLLALTFLATSDATWRLMQVVLAAISMVQLYHIIPFTPVWRKQSADYDPATDQGEGFRLLACNVKMSNRDFDGLAVLIRESVPDLFVLMEVDEKWLAGLAGLLAAYPYVVAQPQDNSYGMVLASKFELRDQKVQYLLTEGVPSIITDVVTPAEQVFRLYFIHPEPPVPHRGAEGRDGETGLVALKVREEKKPVIVTGDLNDVAWSGTTERFRRISRLLDPRIGRKVFSTFDARYPLIRWPLDHLFHSPEFRLAGMKRLPPCGSDHFPVVFDLVLCPDGEAESHPEQADEDDVDRAKELASEAKARDESPIGTDWEK